LSVYSSFIAIDGFMEKSAYELDAKKHAVVNQRQKLMVSRIFE
jgi:hypothetical protein